jgi:hypothetical protein
VACSDGYHLELVTPPSVGAGLDWVVPAVVAKRHQFTELLIDVNGPAAKLIAPLEHGGIVVRRVSRSELVQASGRVVDAITAREARHLDQPQLNRAVARAAKRDVGDGAWVLSRSRSSVDIGPLVACALAMFGSSTSKAAESWAPRRIR